MITIGAFGSVLGGLMTMAGFFIAIWATFTITDNYLVFLLFPLFGLLGGFALGALNARKARNQEKYKNEYIAYASMAFAAIVFLSLYYFIFSNGLAIVAEKNASQFDDEMVVVIAAVSGILMELGLGLVIANSLAESSGY